MDKEQAIGIQRDFSGFHRLLVILIFVYTIEEVMNNGDERIFWITIVAVLLLLVERYLLSKEDRKLGSILVLRYIQICFGIFCLSASNSIYNFAFSLICLSLFSVEYYLTFDFSDGYYRAIFILSIGVPLESLVLLSGMIRSRFDERLFSLAFVLGVYICVLVLFANLFAKLVRQNDERFFAQVRQINNVNEANEELLINQNKLERANELLGVKKIQLEAAYRKINSVNSEMMIQNEIIKYISSSLELGTVMNLITESILNEIGLDVCAIVLFPNATKSKKNSYRVKTRYDDKFMEHLSQSIEKQCFNQYLSLEGNYIDNRVEIDHYDFIINGMIGSLMIVPLVKRDAIIGCLFVAHPDYDYFKENIRFYEGIVGHFLVALDNANLYAKMESMAVRDGLTGIYNRRHLTKLFHESIKSAMENQTPLTAALFDIDHFKRINDTYGHLFGDTVIQMIASLALRIAEQYDGIVGRYGGEEFVVFFSQKGLQQAYEPVSLLHKQVKEQYLEHNGQKVVVNVSIGISCYPETCKNPDELLNRADQAMYYSKQNGRDCITIDSESIKEKVMLV